MKSLLLGLLFLGLPTFAFLSTGGGGGSGSSVNTSPNDMGTLSGAISVNVSSRPNQKVALSGAATISFTGATSGQTGVLEIAPNGYATTWGANIRFPKNVYAAATPTGLALDTYRWYYNGTDYQLNVIPNVPKSDATYTPSVSFNYPNDSTKYHEVPSSPITSLSSPWTINAWTKIPTGGGGQLVCAGMEFYVSSSLIEMQIDFNNVNGQYVWWDSVSGISANAWHQVTIVNDGLVTGTSITMYADRSLVSSSVSGAIPSSPMTNTGVMRFGKRVWNGTQGFNGKILEVSFWNKALSSSEITALATGGKPVNALNHSARANLTGWFQFGNNPADSAAAIYDVVGGLVGTGIGLASGNIVSDAP